MIIVSVEKCKVGMMREDEQPDNYQECIINPKGTVTRQPAILQTLPTASKSFFIQIKPRRCFLPHTNEEPDFCVCEIFKILTHEYDDAYVRCRHNDVDPSQVRTWLAVLAVDA